MKTENTYELVSRQNDHSVFSLDTCDSYIEERIRRLRPGVRQHRILMMAVPVLPNP